MKDYQRYWEPDPAPGPLGGLGIAMIGCVLSLALGWFTWRTVDRILQ
jgi:peptidoglycan/LPS O-acetylase OafA/YrhL